jgi:hypothetical protein
VDLVPDLQRVLQEPHDLQIAGAALRGPRRRAVVDEVVGDQRSDAVDVVRGEGLDDLAGQFLGDGQRLAPLTMGDCLE